MRLASQITGDAQDRFHGIQYEFRSMFGDKDVPVVTDTCCCTMTVIQFPTYDELPEPIPGYKCSWDYFNSLHTSSAGSRDALGTVRLSLHIQRFVSRLQADQVLAHHS
jgi:hypothetical protein